MKIRYALAFVGLLALQDFKPKIDSESRSISEKEKEQQEARDRAQGDQRPGLTPEEAIQGSSSGTGIGRASNPWGTQGKSQRGDQWDYQDSLGD